MDHRDPFFRTVSILTHIAEIPAVKKIIVFMLASALLCVSAFGFVRLFSDAADDSGMYAASGWMIRNNTGDAHPLEAVKDEDVSSITVYQLSLNAHNSGVKAGYALLRLIVRALLDSSLGMCCVLVVRRTSSVCWIPSTCSHLYIISYISCLSFHDRSSLRR